MIIASTTRRSSTRRTRQPTPRRVHALEERRLRLLESGLSMAMAATGTRGQLVAGGPAASSLAFKADALWVGTGIAVVEGPEGRLKATDAAGAGLDVGGGVTVSSPSAGLSVDLRMRMLVVHQAEERGMSLPLSYNPRPSTPLGFTAKVAPSWGGQATGGAQATSEYGWAYRVGYGMTLLEAYVEAGRLEEPKVPFFQTMNLGGRAV